VDQREAAAIREQLLGAFQPEDTVLYASGLGNRMFSTYYQYKGQKAGGIDSTRFFLPGGGEYYMFMSPRLESHYIGSGLYGLMKVFPTMYDYCALFSRFAALYPQSKWLEAIEQAFSPCQEAAPVPDSSFLAGNGIEELSQLPALLGNRAVLVNLWATWCGPCIEEMRLYGASFYDYLSSSNIELVCVSIDKPADEAKWRKMVGKMGLQGKHVLASPALVQSLKTALYQGQPLTIPRYILLGANREILEADMPRPSEKRFKSAIGKLMGD
jgi:thiol-disulfide isomerase/thioredoxin